MNHEDKIVPIFESFEALQKREQQIADDFVAEWAAAYAEWHGTLDAIKLMKSDIASAEPPPLKKFAWQTDDETLAALSESSRAQIKSIKDLVEAHSHKMGVGTALLNKKIAIIRAEQNALEILLDAREAAIERRNEGLCGVGDAARRSHRFAMAASRKYYGPGATLLSIEAKR